MAKSKFFRVATEGATTDGRVIQRVWIDQMAANYSRAKYGARVFLEHIRGLLPDSPFRAYGDVLALEAREVEDGKLALFAQIEPTPDLVKLVKAKQKIYTSIEVAEKFAGGAEAYLVGLGITDSPASLGTDVLAFAAQNPDANPFSARKVAPENLFSAAEETTVELESENETPSLLAKVRELFGRKAGSDDKRFADIEQAVESVAGHAGAHADRLDALEAAHTATQAQLAEGGTAIDSLRTELNALATRIEHTAAPDPTRPQASGGADHVLTNC